MILAYNVLIVIAGYIYIQPCDIQVIDIQWVLLPCLGTIDWLGFIIVVHHVHSRCHDFQDCDHRRNIARGNHPSFIFYGFIRATSRQHHNWFKWGDPPEHCLLYTGVWTPQYTHVVKFIATSWMNSSLKKIFIKICYSFRVLTLILWGLLVPIWKPGWQETQLEWYNLPFFQTRWLVLSAQDPLAFRDMLELLEMNLDLCASKPVCSLTLVGNQNLLVMKVATIGQEQV